MDGRVVGLVAVAAQSPASRPRRQARVPSTAGAQRRVHGSRASSARSPTRPRARSARARGRGAGSRRRTSGRRRTSVTIPSAARAPPRRRPSPACRARARSRTRGPGILRRVGRGRRRWSRHDQSRDPLRLHARPGRLGPMRRDGVPVVQVERLALDLEREQRVAVVRLRRGRGRTRRTPAAAAASARAPGRRRRRRPGRGGHAPRRLATSATRSTPRRTRSGASRCAGGARGGRRVRARPDGARRLRPRAGTTGSCAASTTPAATAERFTGKPCGPVSGRRGASSASLRSGHTVWPTVTRVRSPAGAGDQRRGTRAGRVTPGVERRRRHRRRRRTGCRTRAARSA